MDVFRQCAEINPNHSDSFLMLGKLFERRGRTEEAVEAYRQAVRVDPQNWPAYRALGTVLNLESRHDEAAAVFQQWALGEPDNPIPRHHLAALLGNNVPSRAADEYVSKVFDLFADSFDRQLERLQYRAPHLVSEAITTLCGLPLGNLDILDAGCGTGLCAPLLRSAARWLVGVDLSPAMLEKGRERGDYDALHQGELTAFMNQVAAQFDVIVSADTFCYFGELESVIKAAATALRQSAHPHFVRGGRRSKSSSHRFLGSSIRFRPAGPDRPVSQPALPERRFQPFLLSQLLSRLVGGRGLLNHSGLKVPFHLCPSTSTTAWAKACGAS